MWEPKLIQLCIFHYFYRFVLISNVFLLVFHSVYSLVCVCVI